MHESIDQAPAPNPDEVFAAGSLDSHQRAVEVMYQAAHLTNEAIAEGDIINPTPASRIAFRNPDSGNSIIGTNLIAQARQDVARDRAELSSAGLNEAADSPELARAKQLFAPLPRPEELGRDDADMRWRASVTDASLKEAEGYFRGLKTDLELYSTFQAYTDRTGNYKDYDVMAGIRHDPELRIKVGQSLQREAKANEYAVRSGPEQKSPNARGYEGIKPTSQEYVALLMLAMVDGTFKSADADPGRNEKFYSPTVGLHRPVAERLLAKYPRH